MLSLEKIYITAGFSTPLENVKNMCLEFTVLIIPLGVLYFYILTITKLLNFILSSASSIFMFTQSWSNSLRRFNISFVADGKCADFSLRKEILS